MRLLMDTHTALWAATADPRLSATADAALRDPNNELFFSDCSLWEIAIKRSLGKLTMPVPTRTFVSQLRAQGVTIVAIRQEHVLDVESLPLHHRDPFDRLLIAQGRRENHSILGADTHFDAYGVHRIW